MLARRTRVAWRGGACAFSVARLSAAAWSVLDRSLPAHARLPMGRGRSPPTA